MIIGDKGRFAIELSWQDCPKLGDDGQRVTWAVIQLYCKGGSLTRHLMKDEVHQDILGPASTIATWLLSNWPALMHEERVIGAPRATYGHELLEKLNDTEWDEYDRDLDAWWHSHNLRGANQGLQLPNVIFWRRGSSIAVSWKNDSEPRTDHKIQFLPGNDWALFPAQELNSIFRDFIKTVAEKIRSAHESSAAREAVLTGLERLDAPWHQRLDTLARKLGRPEALFIKWLDPKRRTPAEMRELFKSQYGIDPAAYLDDQVDGEVAMAARSASPSFTEADHHHLFRLKNQLDQHRPAEGLSSLRKKLEDDLQAADAAVRMGGEEHECGYLLARATRKALRNKTKHLDIEPLLKKFGISIIEEEFEDQTTDGVTLWRQDDRAIIVINQSSPRAATTWGRRAVLAHELYHLVADSFNQHIFGECTSQFTPSPSERRANAFSAELLLPSSALPKYLGSSACRMGRIAA